MDSCTLSFYNPMIYTLSFDYFDSGAQHLQFIITPNHDAVVAAAAGLFFSFACFRYFHTLKPTPNINPSTLQTIETATPIILPVLRPLELGCEVPGLETVDVGAGIFIVPPVVVGVVADASTALVRTWIG
jgi:hypothetical protein